MQVICHCGNTLHVKDIRLVPAAKSPVQILSIFVMPCLSCGETRYQQGYEAHRREVPQEDALDPLLPSPYRRYLPPLSGAEERGTPDA